MRKLLVFILVIIVLVVNSFIITKIIKGSKEKELVYKKQIENYQKQIESYDKVQQFAVDISQIYPRTGGKLLKVIDKIKNNDFEGVEKEFKDLPVKFNDVLTYELKETHSISKYLFVYNFFKLPIRDIMNTDMPDQNSFVTCEYGSGYIKYFNADSEEHELVTLARKHNGIDIVNIYNRGVYASADGVVVKAGKDRNYGNYIIIEHKIGDEVYRTCYAHLSLILIKEGEELTFRTPIGIMGNTGGMSFGTHLHWSIMKQDASGSFYTINSVANTTYAFKVSDDKYYLQY